MRELFRGLFFTKRLILPVSSAVLALTFFIFLLWDGSPSDNYEEIISVDSGVGVEKPVQGYAYHTQIPSTRELSEYYSRRQYPGSPPIIPHPLSQENGDFSCMNCHQNGGYVPRFSAYTPITPHPQFINCQQCHVSGLATGDFKGVGIDWQSVQPPNLRRAAIAGGPPPIPHTLQLRENCLSCHAGPAAVKQIRTTHPERVNCTQCHVPQNSETAWVRK